MTAIPRARQVSKSSPSSCFFGLVESGAHVFIEIRVAEMYVIASASRAHASSSMWVLNSAPRGRQSFSACHEGAHASCRQYRPTGRRRSRQIAQGALCCAKDYKAPVPPDASSDRRWRTKDGQRAGIGRSSYTDHVALPADHTRPDRRRSDCGRGGRRRDPAPARARSRNRQAGSIAGDLRPLPAAHQARYDRRDKHHDWRQSLYARRGAGAAGRNLQA